MGNTVGSTYRDLFGPKDLSGVLHDNRRSWNVNLNRKYTNGQISRFDGASTHREDFPAWGAPKPPRMDRDKRDTQPLHAFESTSLYQDSFLRPQKYEGRRKVAKWDGVDPRMNALSADTVYRHDISRNQGMSPGAGFPVPLAQSMRSSSTGAHQTLSKGLVGPGAPDFGAALSGDDVYNNLCTQVLHRTYPGKIEHQRANKTGMAPFAAGSAWFGATTYHEHIDKTADLCVNTLRESLHRPTALYLVRGY